MKYGVETLSDAELFAIILRTGTKNENVVEVANKLITEYGLDKLFECSLKELRKIKGIGNTKAIELLTIGEIQKRINNSKNPIKKISSAKDVFDYFYEKLKDEKQENFYILILNNQNNIIKEQLISKGIIDDTDWHKKVIDILEFNKIIDSKVVTLSGGELQR